MKNFILFLIFMKFFSIIISSKDGMLFRNSVGFSVGNSVGFLV